MKDDNEKMVSTIVRIDEDLRNDMRIFAIRNKIPIMEYTDMCIKAGHELLSKQGKTDQESNEKKAV